MKGADPDDTLVADHRHLDGRPVLHRRDERHDGGRRRKNVLEHDTRLVQIAPVCSLTNSSCGSEAPPLQERQRRKHPVRRAKKARHLPCDLSWPRGSPRRSRSRSATLLYAQQAWRSLHQQRLHRRRPTTGSSARTCRYGRRRQSAVFFTRVRLAGHLLCRLIASLTCRSIGCLHSWFRHSSSIIASRLHHAMRRRGVGWTGHVS